MIDLKKAKLEFDNYAKKYDITDETINRKYHHTYRVMNIAGEIAKSINLDSEEINLFLIYLNLSKLYLRQLNPSF